MSICVNHDDVKFAKKNFYVVEKQRLKQVMKEEELCYSDKETDYLDDA